MSRYLVICCEAPQPYGRCGAYLPTGTADEAEANVAAARAGWSANPDRCPGHTFRPRTSRTVRRLRPATERTSTP